MDEDKLIHVILSKVQSEWLEKKAKEDDLKKSQIIRHLISAEMRKEIKLLEKGDDDNNNE